MASCRAAYVAAVVLVEVSNRQIKNSPKLIKRYGILAEITKFNVRQIFPLYGIFV